MVHDYDSLDWAAASSPYYSVFRTVFIVEEDTGKDTGNLFRVS